MYVFDQRFILLMQFNIAVAKLVITKARSILL